jgi:hypothetical protein
VVAPVGCRGGFVLDAGSCLNVHRTLDGIVTSSILGRVSVIADKNAVGGNFVANEVYAARGRMCAVEMSQILLPRLFRLSMPSSGASRILVNNAAIFSTLASEGALVGCNSVREKEP